MWENLPLTNFYEIPTPRKSEIPTCIYNMRNLKESELAFVNFHHERYFQRWNYDETITVDFHSFLKNVQSWSMEDETLPTVWPNAGVHLRAPNCNLYLRLCWWTLSKQQGYNTEISCLHNQKPPLVPWKNSCPGVSILNINNIKEQSGFFKMLGILLKSHKHNCWKNTEIQFLSIKLGIEVTSRVDDESNSLAIDPPKNNQFHMWWISAAPTKIEPDDP